MMHINPRSDDSPIVAADVTPLLPPLLASLYQQARHRQENPYDLATQLGCTVSYLLQLSNGTRKTERIARPFTEACARYLGVTPIEVQVMAGQIQARDFIVPGLPASELASGLRRLSTDRTLGALMPAALWQAHRDIQHYVLWLYHEARHQIACSHRLPQRFDDVLCRTVQQDALLSSRLSGGKA